MLRSFLACVVCLPLLGASIREHPQEPKHPRLKQEKPEGRREKLAVGTLFLPAKLKTDGKVPLFVHFHGGEWLPEVAAAGLGNTAVITVQLGNGSAVYAKPFTQPQSFLDLVAEAEKKAGVKFAPITLSGWSAGYGAVREILKSPAAYGRIQGILLLDGMHAGYVKDPQAKEKLRPEHLEVFVQFAKDAAAGKKRMLVTHTEIVPGTYASTTETADYLLDKLHLKREAKRQIGPMQTQQLTEARQGRFVLQGYVGNTAADHVDHLHALPEFLAMMHP